MRMLFTSILLIIHVSQLAQCSVMQDWKCPSDYPSAAANLLNNPSFDTPSTINSNSAQNWLSVNYAGNQGYYGTPSSVLAAQVNDGQDTSLGEVPTHSGDRYEVWGASSSSNPNSIKYQETDGIPGGPSKTASGLPYLFSFFARGSDINADGQSSSLFVTWNGATIQDDSSDVDQSVTYNQYCLPVAFIGSSDSAKNSLQFGGYDFTGYLYIDDVALVQYGTTTTIDPSTTTTFSTTVTMTASTTIITVFTTTTTSAISTFTSTPTNTVTPTPSTSSIIATSTSTITQVPVTIISSTLPCTQAHLTFSSACCPRSYCKTQPTAAPTAHRRSLSTSQNNDDMSNIDKHLIKRDTPVMSGITTYSLSGTSPTITYLGTSTSTVSTTNTITVSTLATSTLSTASTSTISSTTITAPASTTTLKASTITSTYSTSTVTTTLTPPAITSSACRQVLNVPPFPCPNFFRQQALLNAFELKLLNQYKALAPKAFPTILVSCQGDPKTYVY